MRRHSAARAASEAQAAAQALGGSLAAFEIGNYRTETSYETSFNSYVAAIRAKVPTAVFDGPGESENGALVMLSMHRYISSSRTATIPGMPASNPSRFEGDETAIASVKSANHIPLWRMTEANSYSHGGAAGVSDVEAAALWSLDFMDGIAAHDGDGLNFHGGTSTPFIDNERLGCDGDCHPVGSGGLSPGLPADSTLICFEGDHHRRLRGERQRVAPSPTLLSVSGTRVAVSGSAGSAVLVVTHQVRKTAGAQEAFILRAAAPLSSPPYRSVRKVSRCESQKDEAGSSQWWLPPHWRSRPRNPGARQWHPRLRWSPPPSP